MPVDPSQGYKQIIEELERQLKDLPASSLKAQQIREQIRMNEQFIEDVEEQKKWGVKF